MSSFSLDSIASSQIQSLVKTSQSGSSTSDADATDFASSLSLRLAEFETQALNMLIAAKDGKSTTSIFDTLFATQNGNSLPSSSSSSSSSSTDIYALLCSSGIGQQTTDGLSADGYNPALADPQSAYRMMTLINDCEVKYKAQFAELSEMKDAVDELEASGQTLGSVDARARDEAIISAMQAFADEYNEWITRFADSVEDNGVLAGTQAAEVSLYELEQSVENDFNGATSGFHGVDELGLTIDAQTNLATLDAGVLSAALASNRSGVVNTLKEFSSNFVKSADLLTSSDNFIVNRLDNLDRAIDYIDDNLSSLQSEFGRGDAARPTAQVAAALAVYDQTYASA